MLTALALVQGACGAPAGERPLLGAFFHAARLHDRTQLARIATVPFSPRTEGTVQQFEIVRIIPEAQADGAIVKRVTVDARVRTPDGRIGERRMTVTLERTPERRRWMIVGVEGSSG